MYFLIGKNYNILFQGFETGQDFANQILTNPKFNYLNLSAQTGVSLNISNELKLKMSYILSLAVSLKTSSALIAE